MTKPIRRLTAEDYAVDAVTMAKALGNFKMKPRSQNFSPMRNGEATTRTSSSGCGRAKVKQPNAIDRRLQEVIKYAA